MFSDNLGLLAAAVSPADVSSTIMPIFRGLCGDYEPEIRASAVYHMADLLAVCFDTSAKKDILMTGTRLLSDVHNYVRMSLAGAVLKSVKYVPKELWGTTIVPTCTSLLADKEPDVRLALISGFSSMT
uniref:Serine/threonine-protein phosphatase 2A 65 kDa regulatory subunit A alpha isoform n=1 Tax=Lygus hesperus TaxID=30085 RepID=A0A0A9Y945_LYGHE